MSRSEPRQRRVSLKELAELCGDDADALYWVSQQQPESIDGAREFLRNWNEQIRPWLSEFEEEYRDDDPEAAFRFMAIAASFASFPVPKWVAQAIYSGWHEYTNWKPGAESINAAMGVKREGAKEKENRRRIHLRNLVMWLINDHKTLRNRAVDKDLYDDVAKQLLDPSTIPQPYIRAEAERTLQMLREEFGEPLTELSGTTVGRWYGEMKQLVAGMGKETTADPEKSGPRYHFIFENKK